jgi:hypothetical protein
MDRELELASAGASEILASDFSFEQLAEKKINQYKR